MTTEPRFILNPRAAGKVLNPLRQPHHWLLSDIGISELSLCQDSKQIQNTEGGIGNAPWEKILSCRSKPCLMVCNLPLAPLLV